MRIGDIAQRIMDLYYQGYATDEDFFSLPDFVSQVKSAYTNQIITDYESDKLLNQQLEGFSFITLPMDLLKYEDIEVKKDEMGVLYVPLSKPVFVFPYDSMASGVQSIQRVVKDRITSDFFVKVSVNDLWKLDHIMHGNRTYFSVQYNKIIFEKTGCNFDKIRIGYVPMVSSMTEDDEIADTRVDRIEISVLQKMLAAKQGVIIDQSNNSNPNKAIETEIDSNQMKK